MRRDKIKFFKLCSFSYKLNTLFKFLFQLFCQHYWPCLSGFFHSDTHRTQLISNAVSARYFHSNIPTKTTESRDEAEKELHRFFDEVLSQTGITRRGVYKVHIPRYCNQMQLEDPDEHAVVLEKCQGIRFQTNILGLSSARSPINPLNC